MTTAITSPQQGGEEAEFGFELLDLIGRLREADVRLTADDGTLGYDAPPDALTPELLDAMRRHKSDLLRWLDTPAGRSPVDASGPATVYQHRMHQQHTGGPNPAGFNVAQRIPLSGPLDMDALHRALTALARRQSVLRCRFAHHGSRLVQEVVPLEPVELPVTDLRELTGEQREQAAADWLRDHAERPFDLAAAPLWRTALLRTGDKDAALLIVVHHIVIDGWGLDVLLRDLGALYTAALRVPAPRLPSDDEAGLEPLALSYPDVGRWQQRHLSGPRLEELRSFWRRTLDGAPLTAPLPTDRPRPEHPTGRGGDVTVRIPAERARALRALAAAEGTTVFTVLLAAFGVVLADMTGRPETVVSCNIANRIRREHESLVGHFTNNVMLRLEAGPDTPFPDVVAATGRRFFAAADHQDYPLPMLRRDLVDGLVPPGAPFPRVIVVMQTQGIPELSLGGITGEAQDVPVNRAVAELCLVLVPEGEEIVCTLNYAADLFDHATVERWTAAYLAVLEREAGRDRAGQPFSAARPPNS